MRSGIRNREYRITTTKSFSTRCSNSASLALTHWSLVMKEAKLSGELERLLRSAKKLQGHEVVVERNMVFYSLTTVFKGCLDVKRKSLCLGLKLNHY